MQDLSFQSGLFLYLCKYKICSSSKYGTRNTISSCHIRSSCRFSFDLREKKRTNRINDGQYCWSFSGIIMSTCTNPLWFIKTRLQIDRRCVEIDDDWYRQASTNENSKQYHDQSSIELVCIEVIPRKPQPAAIEWRRSYCVENLFFDWKPTFQFSFHLTRVSVKFLPDFPRVFIRKHWEDGLEFLVFFSRNQWDHLQSLSLNVTLVTRRCGSSQNEICIKNNRGLNTFHWTHEIQVYNVCHSQRGVWGWFSVCFNAENGRCFCLTDSLISIRV